MYNNLPNIPFILKSDSVNVLITDVVNDVSTIKNFNLSQNYPNPFNPSTKINYQIQLASQVSLKIFDVLGNEVATLVDENKSAGNYEIEFYSVDTRRNASLPSGVYFYKLEATPNNGGKPYREVRKMVLLK
jgi:hypothetical protein